MGPSLSGRKRWEWKGGGKVGGGEGEGGLDRSGSTREGVDEGQSTSSLVHPGGSKLAPLHQNFQILCKPSFSSKQQLRGTCRKRTCCRVVNI